MGRAHSSGRGSFAAQTFPTRNPAGGGSSGGITTVANLAALTALSLATFTEGGLVYVQTLQSYFSLDLVSTTPVDGITVVTTSAGGTTRWIREPIASPEWARRDIWFIDAVLGNNENTGLTALTALASHAELARRWGPAAFLSPPPGGQVTPFGTRLITVTINSNLPSTDPIRLDVYLDSDLLLAYVGGTTTVRSGTFTAVTAKSRPTNQPWVVADVGIGSWAADVNRRVRITAGANAGQKSWVVAVDLSMASAARMSDFSEVFAPPADQIDFTFVTPGVAAVADPYVVEDLRQITIDHINAQIDAAGNLIEFPIIGFMDFDVQNFGGFGFITAGVSDTAFLALFGCRFRSAVSVTSGQNNFLNCLLEGGLQALAGSTDVDGGLIRSACIVTQSASVRLDADAMLQGTSINTIGGGNVVLGFVSVFDVPASFLNPTGAAVTLGNQRFSGPGNAQLAPQVYGGAALWGAGNTGPGVECGGNGVFVRAVAITPTITGAGGDFRMGQTALGLVTIDPSTGAAAAAIDQTWANLVAARPAGFGQNAINPTNYARIVELL